MSTASAKGFVTIPGVEGRLRERWELWDREFNHGLSPVSRDGICCHHLFYFSAYLPTYETMLAAQKRGQRGHFHESSTNAALKFPGSNQSFSGYMWSFALQRGRCNRAATNVINILQEVFLTELLSRMRSVSTNKNCSENKVQKVSHP